jgi:hypothetical protein
VPLDHGEAVKIDDLKGQASCSSARSIAKTYGHPKAVKNSCPSGRECEYGVCADGWRCTGLFHWGFYCWLGGDAKGRGDKASFCGAIVQGRWLDRNMKAGLGDQPSPRRSSSARSASFKVKSGSAPKTRRSLTCRFS